MLMTSRPDPAEEELEPSRVAVTPYVAVQERLASPTGQTLFIVTGATPSYWRIATLDVYDDHVWKLNRDFELDEELIDITRVRATANGGSVEITNDIDAAFAGAEVIYAKSWGAKQFYGDTDRDLAERAQFRDKWIVDENKMSRTNQGKFMHCLPVRRNVIVTDGVIDSQASVVIDQAENRLHAQKAVMAELL
jgi:N-acetylornithine carbamoyltransferase